MADARSYIYSLGSSGLTLCIALVTSTLVNRFLGPLERGEFASLTYAAVTASGLVAAAVSPQAVVRHINRHGASDITAAVVVTVLQTLVSIPIALIVMAMFHRQAGTPLHVAVALVLGTAISQTMYNGLCAIQRSQFKFKLVAVTVVSIPAAYTLLLCLCVGLARLDPATAMVASSMPVLLCVVFLIIRLPNKVQLKALPWRGVADCLREGIAFLPVTAMALLLASTDRALILKLSDLTALGYFAAASGLSSPLAIAAEAIVQVSFVEVSGHGDAGAARAVALARFRTGQLVILAMAAGVALVGPWFLVTASGAVFAAAVPVLLWLIGAAIARGLATLLDTSLRALGLLTHSLAITGLGLATMLICGLLLIPAGAAVGAAQAVLIAYLVMLAAQLIVWHWRMGARWSEFWGFDAGTLHRIMQLFTRFSRVAP